jgi:hypothetical protein
LLASVPGLIIHVLAQPYVIQGVPGNGLKG